MRIRGSLVAGAAGLLIAWAALAEPSPILKVQVAGSADAGGYSLRPDSSGKLPVTGTFYQAIQPVSGTVNVAVVDGGPLPVTTTNPFNGAVTGTFWQATQPVSPLANSVWQVSVVDGGPLLVQGNWVALLDGGTGRYYANGDIVPTPTGPMMLGYDGTYVRALKTTNSGVLVLTVDGGVLLLDQNQNVNVNLNTLIAGENLDAGWLLTHLDPTSALAANQSVNVAQVNGVTTLMGNGVTGTGSQRVTVASDNTPFPVKIDQTTPGTTNAVSLSHVGSTAVATGNGVVGAGVQRVAIASDNSPVLVNGIVNVSVVDGGPLLVAQSVSRDGGWSWPVEMYGYDGTTPRRLTLSDEGDLHTLSQPAELYVNRDQKLGAKEAHAIKVMGKRTLGWSSTSVLGDVASYLDTSQALINPVDPAVHYYLRSSAAADAYNSTGARGVRVTYLPADAGIETSTVWPLDGGQPIDLGTQFDFFQFMEVDSLGTAEVSAGDITISTTSTYATPTVASTVEMIAAGGNRSLSCRYKVPPDHDAFLTTWNSVAVGNNQDIRIRATAYSDNGHNLSSVFHFIATSYVIGNTAGVSGDMRYWRVPSGAVIKASSVPTASGAANRADVNFYLMLIAK